MLLLSNIWPNQVRVGLGCNCQKLEVHAQACGIIEVRTCVHRKEDILQPKSVWDMFEKNIFLSVRFLWSTAWPADLMLIESTSK